MVRVSLAFMGCSKLREEISSKHKRLMFILEVIARLSTRTRMVWDRFFGNLCIPENFFMRKTLIFLPDRNNLRFNFVEDLTKKCLKNNPKSINMSQFYLIFHLPNICLVSCMNRFKLLSSHHQ